MIGASSSTLLYIVVPGALTILLALIGVLWRAGAERGREDERWTDANRRFDRIERKLFNGGSDDRGDRRR